MKAKVSSNEIRCGRCSHLLAKVMCLPTGRYSVQVKCHSCKQLNFIESDGDSKDKEEKSNG